MEKPGSDKLVIFDTTLRDGEQCPGASMNVEEKLQIAKMLEQLKVDVIEAGFPISSPGDFAGVKKIAAELKHSTICSLARATEVDINKAAEAMRPAEKFRIHTFIATSDIHMQFKLHATPEQVLEKAVAAVKLARNYTDDVEFSAEDAGRSDFDFLCKVFELVIQAGATTLNVPDTVGYTLPHQYGQLIKNLIENIPNSDQACFSTHCHNDLGLAVANSLAGVLNGARQVECTINGIGERAGNAALEEVVMALKTRQDAFPCQVMIDTTAIVNCSKLVSQVTGFMVQPNKAIVGANAFAHEAGIHQDGILKSRDTYEIMRAEDVGWNSNQLIMGKHSGHNAFKTRLQALGFRVDDDKLVERAFREFKLLADERKVITDNMLQELMKNILADG